MSLNLDNKVVIITGATGGIGGEIAIDFLKEKSIVICLYRNEFKMGKFKSELAEKNIPNCLHKWRPYFACSNIFFAMHM